MKRFPLPVLIVVCLASLADAQPSRFDVSVSLGRVFFDGQSPPNVETIGVGAAVWLTESLGVAWSMDVGSDMVAYKPWIQPPFPQGPGDRKLIERGNLRLQRITIRYRRSLWPSAHLMLGGGAFVAKLDERYLLAHTLTNIEDRLDRFRWSGLSFESLLQQRLAGPVALEAGLLIEGALDLGHLHPIVQVTCGF